MNESKAWTGRPSQWSNARTYFGAILVILLLAVLAMVIKEFQIPILVLMTAPLARVVWAYLKVKCIAYELTDQRFKYKTGVFSRHFHEVELYRIKDVVLDQPILLRIVGLANITVVGFDMVRPLVKIRAIREGAEVREAFRNLTEACRDTKSVRVSEIG